VIDLPGGEEPEVIIKSSSGELTMRTLNIDGHEVHRCPMAITGSPWLIAQGE
jgi:hypothetical protein